jgi:hypothetical protein
MVIKRTSDNFTSGLEPEWMSVDDTCALSGEGRTRIFEKIKNREILSKREGRRRLVHRPSLLAKYAEEVAALKAAQTRGLQSPVRTNRGREYGTARTLTAKHVMPDKPHPSDDDI